MGTVVLGSIEGAGESSMREVRGQDTMHCCNGGEKRGRSKERSKEEGEQMHGAPSRQIRVESCLWL